MARILVIFSRLSPATRSASSVGAGAVIRAPRGPLARPHHRRWFEEITNWHRAHVSNGPTEAVNNLIKRIKRIGFGFRSFTSYRIRVILYSGRPNWDLLPTITPR